MRSIYFRIPVSAVGGILALLCFTTAFTHAVASDVDLRAAILANPCAGCHGMDGVSPGPIPSINHLTPAAVVAAMKAFKSDERPGTVMNRIAKGYTDEEIQRIADYFQALNAPTKP